MMRYLRISVVAALMAGLAATAAHAQSARPDYIFRVTADFKDSTKHCNGVLISVGWQVLTAAHCVADRDGTAATVTVSSGSLTLTASRVKVHPAWLQNAALAQTGDMALLSFGFEDQAALRALGAPQIVSTSIRQSYDTVILMGFPQGSGPMHRFSCRMERLGVPHSRAHRCDTGPGFSGAPIFTESANRLVLVGLHTRAADTRKLARVFTPQELRGLSGGAPRFWITLDAAPPKQAAEDSDTSADAPAHGPQQP